MSTLTPQKNAVRVCATCGQALTHVGPDGECMRCLVSFGFLSEEQQSRPADSIRTAIAAPLRYAHFQVEVNPDGYPKILGAGAMAVTYCARDTVLNSAVALKVIGRKFAENETARARFLREARAAAQIQHPNVARVIHYGDQDGECFYAMELVKGETLEDRVQRDGPLPLSVALEVVEQVARGLAAGESCGVIHRDLKPSNLMIHSDPTGQMLIKIIDYGVAKVLTVDPTIQTEAGFIGTPAFASPEQFQQVDQRQIDTRSDIYSLGIVLWYLLTGRTPFRGATIEEIRAKQAGPLPLQELKSAHVPARVVSLLSSMLALEPMKRPQTSRDLLTQIHHCYVRFEPAARLRRKHLVFGAGALALLIGAAGFSIWEYQRLQSTSALDRSIAVLPFENLSSNKEDQFFAVGIQDEILTKLATLADLKVIARTSTQGYETKPVDLRTVGRQLNVGRVLEGSLQRSADKVRINVQLIDTRTNAHLWANSYDRTLNDVFGVESEVANIIAQQLDAKLVQRISAAPPTQNTLAYNAYLRGVGIQQSQTGFSSYQDAAHAFEEATQLDPKFALAWARLSLVRSYLYFNGVDQSTNSAVAVKDAADRAIELAPELGEAWLAQGTYQYRVVRDVPAALRAYNEAEKRLPNSALVNQYMAVAERRVGRWRDALAHIDRAIELDPRNATLLTAADVGIYRPLRRWNQAQAALNRALEISPNDKYAITLKAQLLQDQGRLDEAAKELARLPDDPSDKGVLSARIQYALLVDDYAQAIARARQVTDALAPEKPLTPQDILLLILQGYAQKWSGRTDEARTTFERVIKELEQANRRSQLPNLGGRSFLALAYAGAGDKDNALTQAQLGIDEQKDDAILKINAEINRFTILAQTGEVDAAIAELPHLLEAPDGISAGDLRYSAFLDPLRNDPRFEALVKNPPPVRY